MSVFNSEQLELFKQILDALDEHIVVIGPGGDIVYVNRAWTNFGLQNGLTERLNWLNENYLVACGISSAGGDLLAGRADQGIKSVMRGEELSFELEYPCHSDTQERWFSMKVRPLSGSAAGFLMINHSNITQQKLAEDMSMHDALTGLANRRHFQDFLTNEWRRCHRDGTSIGLIMLDIDHFKRYNDSLGHIAGDRCLCSVAQVLKNFSRRPGDLAARYGGEEFFLILSGSNLVESKTTAQAIIDAVSQLGMRYSDGKPLTMSAGVVAGKPEKQCEEYSGVAKADHNLYLAKRDGRNKVKSGDL